MQPAAKRGDSVVAIDTHIVVVPGAGPTPMPAPFHGALMRDLAQTLLIDGVPAAILGSGAQNLPSHIPASGPFLKQPSNQGTVVTASTSVLVEEKGLARNGDDAETCNDPSDAPIGKVIATSTVLVG